MRVVPAILLFLALVAVCWGKKPHILFIMADDWGWGDVGWSEYAQIPTPRLQELRAEGLELMQFYNQPKCTAARAALMTARYPYKMGLQSNRVFNRVTNNTLDMSLKILPGYFKDLGYHTHMVGKWHLGHCNHNATPIGRGFDTHFGSFFNTDNHFTFTTNGLYDWSYNNEIYFAANGTYSAHLVSNHTQYVLEKHFGDETTKEEPVFVYVPYLVPHKPAMVPQSYIDNTNCKNLPKYVMIKGENVTNDRRIYCGMVAAMDEGIGNITDTLRSLGVIDDFIIVVTSDNGGAVNVGAGNYPLRGNKQSVYEGGTRVRTLLRAPRFLNPCNSKGEYHGLIHITDVLPTLMDAAGGDLSVLPDDVDGMSAWPYIKFGQPTNRHWMVYNIDSERKLGAIRFKNCTANFKFIYANATPYEVGYRYLDPRPPAEQEEDPRKAGYRSTGAYYLYNLDTNPDERVPEGDRFPDAALANPDIFQMMKQKLEDFTAEEVDPPVYGSLAGSGHKRGGALRGLQKSELAFEMRNITSVSRDPLLLTVLPK
ncbi:arylsulfatase B-like [Babylonia areolata]|uniref:arylsulfatase B-like n=1 Tax=Babylonia areolata TaxID=304850 RepID=UPI003FD2CB2C